MASGSSPADQRTGGTQRLHYDKAKEKKSSGADPFGTGKKYRVVFKRKPVFMPEQQAEALRRAAISGTPVCERCEQIKKGKRKRRAQAPR